MTTATPAAADRPILHGCNRCANGISRTADIPLGAGTMVSLFARPELGISFINLVSPYYNPFPTIVGLGLGALLGNQRIQILPGQPTTADVFANPYFKAACVAGTIFTAPYSSTVSAFSFGFLFCCRLQRSMPAR